MRAVLDYCTGGTKREMPAGTLVLHEGSKTGHLFVLLSPFLGWVSFAVFLSGVVLFARWRRAVSAEHRARVFDREAKTDETRARPDQ